jgi:hypothetical protein
MNWLNRSQRWPWLGAALALLVLLATGGGAYLARGLARRRASLAILGALLLATALGPWADLHLAAALYPLPAPHTSYPRIAFEGEHSRLALPIVPASPSPDASLQTFYVWTQRLGYVPSFSSTLEQALGQGQVLVVVDPTRPFEADEISAVEQFVARGGRLLVLAEPRGSNLIVSQILAPFGLGLETRRATTGLIANAAGQPQAELQVSGVVTGGEPLLSLKGSAPVAALTRHGAGLVVATAFAQPFYDRSMGTTSVIPTPQQRFVYDIEFWLFRGLMSGSLPPFTSSAE